MSRASEVQAIADKYFAQGKQLSPDVVVELARDAASFPSLHEHLWLVSEGDLAMEARINRARHVMMSIKFTSETGAPVRWMMNVPGVAGYSKTETVVNVSALASMKLQQMAREIRGLTARYNAFRSIIPVDILEDIELQMETAAAAAESASSKVAGTSAEAS
jgi:hypothetical protein